jgi:hypothetical protein
MAVGHKWVYKAREGPDVVFEVVGSENVEGAECYKVLRSIGDEATPSFVSLSIEGLAIHKVGADRYDPPFFEFAFPFMPETGERVWVGSIGTRTNGIRSRNIGFVTISLPSGIASAVHVTEEMTTVENKEGERRKGRTVTHVGRTSFWIVRSLSVVKLRGKLNDPHNATPNEFEWTLKSFRKSG